MKDLFTIGEMSKLFDINKKTLRYYDEINLFKPSYIDKNNNYRYYTTEQFEQLNTIKYLKELGMTLSTIKQHLENISIDNILSVFESQKIITEQKIKELEFIQQKIQNRISKINDAKDYKKLNEIREINFEDRSIVVLREKIKTSKDLELSIRKLENAAHKKSSIFLGKVGVSISKDNLNKRLFEEYDSIFFMIEGEKYNKKLLKILT